MEEETSRITELMQFKNMLEERFPIPMFDWNWGISVDEETLTLSVPTGTIKITREALVEDKLVHFIKDGSSSRRFMRKNLVEYFMQDLLRKKASGEI